MANVNVCLFIGRLTRDPEVRTFSTGTKLTTFGLAVNNRRKDNATGEWKDVPMFVDVKCWNGVGEKVAQYLHKGSAIHVEGRLELETWTDKTTKQSRSRHVISASNVQFLDPKPSQNTSPPPPDAGQGESGEQDIPF